MFLLGQLEQLIEDNGKYSLPQVLSTERPDKTTNYLLEGRVCVIVNGSPYVLIAPGTFIDFISSPEDLNLKYQFSNMVKIVRIIGFLIALLLPRTLYCNNKLSSGTNTNRTIICNSSFS